ncbi:hypothetical protein NTE_03400 [Candidatus Nitrososphaera evergladensis SR1]|uniref:Uncharacterized protein n=1 Tax=Candidatus Nitrososphaera evergladensis SR1 TaxID=1459636 RepID=A0A075MWB7_9ARCH|nr:hypothetical protein [Candidatus Nitrososphaera evergladensis]AIF85428.1 hypothetical protein NTE_03400 [Candidatus Nitrososphaera evergladensis SR1]
MAFKVERKPLDSARDTLDIANNLNKPGLKIELPQDKWLKKIWIILKGQVDTSGASTLNEDNPMSLIKNVRLVVNGKAVRTVDFPMLYYLNIFDYHGVVPTRFKTPTTALTNQLFKAVACIDFATNPQAPNGDFSAIDAMLPAQDLSSLSLEVDTGAASDLGTNLTFDNASLYTVLEQVSMDKATEENLYGKNREKLWFILQSMAEKKIDGAYTNYQFSQDLPVGNVLRRSLIKAVDNGIRSDSIVSGFRTRVPVAFMEDVWNWESAQEDDRVGLRLGKLTGTNEIETSSGTAIIPSIRGLVLNDYADLGFINATSLKKGSVVWEANTGSPTGTSKVVMLHEELASAQAALNALSTGR